MSSITRRLRGSVAASLVVAAGGVWAAQTETALSLEQAVAKVQQDTNGKVLSARTRRLGRHAEYSIKVLTPDGHVRVVVLDAPDAPKPPTPAESTKTPAGNGAGN